MKPVESAYIRPASFCDAVEGVYDDPSSGYRFVAARPAQQRPLWLAYLDGAQRSYRKHGVESVLEYDQVVDGANTSLFFVALHRSGAVVGGMRAQGPYTDVDQAHAITEWAGRPGTEQLRREIEVRIPDGLIEMKTGWVEDYTENRRELTDALARIFVHSLRLLNVRHAIGTVGQHALRRWLSCGGVVCDSVQPVAYPGNGYRTVLMSWDSHHFAALASPRQLPKLTSEAAQLQQHSLAASSVKPST